MVKGNIESNFTIKQQQSYDFQSISRTIAQIYNKGQQIEEIFKQPKEGKRNDQQLKEKSQNNLNFYNNIQNFQKLIQYSLIFLIYITMEQNQVCTHMADEKQYICLEESCYEQTLQNQNLKLDCYTCLDIVHNHEDCLIHINDILNQGNKNKQTLLQFIQGQLNFCENITNQLDDQKKEMVENFTQQVIRQYQSQSEQISKYQNILNEQLQIVRSAELSREKLQTSIEYHLMNIGVFEEQNKIIQERIELNKSSFKKFFELNLKRMNRQFCTQIEELPKFSQKYMNAKRLKHEKCDVESCCWIEKKNFCLASACLENKNLQLECSVCQVKKHQDQNIYDDHLKYIITSTKLWEMEKDLIDNLNKQCDEKQKDIVKQSLEMQEKIIECQINTDEKLHQFSKFIIEREKEIVNNLQKIKSDYSKDKFKIYRDLLTMTDFSVLADIKNKEASFKKIQNNFLAQFEADKAKNPLQFQDTWLKGQHIVQKDNIVNLNEKALPLNPVSKHIQELNDKISNLENINNELQKKKETFNSNNEDQLFFQKLENIFIQNSKELLSQFDNMKQMSQNEREKLSKEIDNIKALLIDLNRNLKNTKSGGGCSTQ